MARLVATFVAGLIALTVAAGGALAAPITFFGEDLGLGEDTRLDAHPNADAARDAFVAQLSAAVGTETFEGVPFGTLAPVSLTFPGAGTAVLQGIGFVDQVVSGTNGVGRFPISGTNYFDSGAAFSIDFSNPVSAFGFYGVDIGDFGGRVTLAYENGSTTTLIIPHTQNAPGGSVLYFGVIDILNPFTSVTFGNTSAGFDVFGFDDMTIASPAQVGTTPQPNNPQMPGSILVFPKFIRGTVKVGGEELPKSEFTIAGVCPTGEVCKAKEDIQLLARWVCPPVSQELRHKFVCKETDFRLEVKLRSSVVFNPENVGDAITEDEIPKPPCARGYLIVWAVTDDDGSNLRPIKFDGLIGHAVLRNSARSVSAYTAVPIQAIDDLGTGDETDVNSDGRLQLDGVTEYKAITGQVRGTVRLDRDGDRLAGPRPIDTKLTLLTLDTISNRPNLPTFVDLHFFNADEILLSASHEFVCWSETALSKIDSNLNEFFGRTALLESTEAEKIPIFGITDISGPVTLLGLIETTEHSAAEYAYGLFNDGRSVPTIFEPH
jgi:hypothetical protein